MAEFEDGRIIERTGNIRDPNPVHTIYEAPVVQNEKGNSSDVWWTK
jgi:hypothetical protein